jgi:hypothetical protein
VSTWIPSSLRVLCIDLLIWATSEEVAEFVNALSLHDLPSLKHFQLRIRGLRALPELREKLLVFFRRHAHVKRTGIDAGTGDSDSDADDDEWREIVRSIRSPRLGLLDVFRPAWHAWISADVKQLELHLRISHSFDDDKAKACYAFLDRMSTRAKQGLPCPQRVVFRLDGEYMEGWPRFSWQFMRPAATNEECLRLFSIHISICLAYAVRLRRFGIHVMDEESMAGKSLTQSRLASGVDRPS